MDEVITSPFVHELNEEERQLMQKKRKNNRLNINSRILTENVNFSEINKTIFDKDQFKHLCVYEELEYLEYVRNILKSPSMDIKLFSKIHHFASKDKPPVFF